MFHILSIQHIKKFTHSFKVLQRLKVKTNKHTNTQKTNRAWVKVFTQAKTRRNHNIIGHTFELTTNIAGGSLSEASY